MAHLTGQARSHYVQQMFARIARRYDVMNRLMTFGQDLKWRRYVIQQAHLPTGGKLLDIATGTGDIAYEGQRQRPDIQAVGGDFCIEMMAMGQRYPERQTLQWVGADALALPFPHGLFDAITSGFLLRNVIDLPAALREQVRVTRPGGHIVALDSSPPKRNWLRPFILFHLNYVIPFLGWLVTGEADAYRYLPSSTQKFIGPEALADEMRAAGLVDVGYRLFMFGTIGVHFGRKPLPSSPE